MIYLQNTELVNWHARRFGHDLIFETGSISCTILGWKATTYGSDGGNLIKKKKRKTLAREENVDLICERLR